MKWVWGLLFLWVFLSGPKVFSSSAPFCASFFLKTANILDSQAYSLRRFDQPISDTFEFQNVPNLKYWLTRPEKSVNVSSLMRSWFSGQTAKHRTLHISRDQKRVVSLGTDEVFRIYETESKDLISKFDIQKVPLSFVAVQMEVLHVSENYFVVGIASQHQRKRDQVYKLDRFLPAKLLVLDFQGNVIYSEYIQQVLKRVEISHDESKVLLLDAENVWQVQLNDQKIDHLSHLQSKMLQSFEHRDHLIYQTLRWSEDLGVLFIAATVHRGTETKLFVFETKGATADFPLKAVLDIPAAKVFKIRPLSREQVLLEIATSGAGSSHTTVSELILNL